MTAGPITFPPANLRAVLRAHYLAQVVCDHERKMDNPICACSRIHLGWHLSVGNAVDAWIDHVLGCMTEPVCPAGECDGSGAIWGDECTCGTGPSGYHGAHEPGCGSEPCPAGCWQSSRESGTRTASRDSWA